MTRKKRTREKYEIFYCSLRRFVVRFSLRPSGERTDRACLIGLGRNAINIISTKDTRKGTGALYRDIIHIYDGKPSKARVTDAVCNGAF